MRTSHRLLPILVALTTVLGLAGEAHAASPPGSDNDPARHRSDHAHDKARANMPVPPVACSLKVPATPLTAAGLATPYQLQAGCSETNANQSAFVEAAVIDPATGHLAGIYHPLVVDAGTTPALPPVPPALPADAVVAIWFGSNADTLHLVGDGAANCVNGTSHSDFGQFAYCNAPAFFRAANKATAAGQLAVPALGTGKDGAACPTSRDFSVVDQDQSDNVATRYRIIAGKLAQDTAATDGQGVLMSNGSDEGLLANFIDPALGCAPFTAPSLDNPGARVPALALNELSAAAHQADPVALVPSTDPMVLRQGQPSRTKLAAYRLGVDQQPFGDANPTAYCSHLAQLATARFKLDRDLFDAATGPGGSNLLTFLTNRLAATRTILQCPAPKPAPTAPTTVEDSQQKWLRSMVVTHHG